MKKLCANRVLQAMLVTSLVVFICAEQVKGSGKINVKKVSEKKAIVSFQDSETTHARLSIMGNNFRFYTESIKDVKQYKKVFDLSQLEDGNYSMILESKNYEIVKTFEIKNSDMKISSEKSLIVPEPVFKTLNNNLICKFVNPNENHVYIEFSDDVKTFFTDADSSGKEITKKYDLSGLPVGEYLVTLNAGDYRYTHTFRVN